VVPRRTLEAGYRFRHPTVRGAMADLLPVII
jgi:NAD dependent epimerase/dehydratase family enzyme